MRDKIQNGKLGFKASITVSDSLWMSHMYSLEQRRWLSSMVLVCIYYEAHILLNWNYEMQFWQDNFITSFYSIRF